MKLKYSVWCVLLSLIGSLMTGAWVQAATTPTAGWLEGIHVEGIKTRLRAKLDSGALTSSIHGTNRRTFKRDGERWLRFDFHWYQEKDDAWIGPFTVEAPMMRRIRIKDHEDESRRRPVVILHFSLNDECHEAQFSVVDRTGFNYPVLLGRRFLSGEVLIDPRKTFTKATERKGKSACTKLDDDKIVQSIKRVKENKSDKDKSDKDKSDKDKSDKDKSDKDKSDKDKSDT